MRSQAADVPRSANPSPPRRVSAQTVGVEKPYQRQVDATDEEIDALLYELYGLAGEDIAIVEGRNY